jgi:hypothetical protein
MKQVWTPVAVALLILAPSAALESGTVVRSVQVSPREGAVAIIVQADGPLPSPRVGVLEGPPRIYLDFRDVRTATTGTLVEGHALVRQVRVALHQPQPPITRVVVDLASAAPHRIELGGRRRGQVTIVIGNPAGVQLAPPSPQVVAPRPPAQVTPPPRREPAVPQVAPAPAARPAAPESPTAPGAASRTPRAGASETVVRSVRLAPGEGAVATIVEADGPLPLPKVGVLEGPPRIYLDFRGVRTATKGVLGEGHALVRQVRVALHQPQPPVTRVVIDLTSRAPHRIEAGGRERGELTVVIGAPAGVQLAAPSPQVAAPQTPAHVTPPKLRREPGAPPGTPAPAARPAAPELPTAPGAARRTPGARPHGTVVRSVRLAPEWGAAAVIVEADGPLPSPAIGALRDPPRIYLDFRGVTTATRGFLVEGHPAVRQVRVAVSEVQPPTTRVAIELAKMAPYRIEEGGRERGELRVVFDTPATNQPAPPADSQRVAPAVAGAQATSSPVPSSPERATAVAATPPPSGAASGEVAARASAKDVERYLQQASSGLDRLERLRPVLTSLDALTPVSGLDLKAAAGEFDSIRQGLAAIEPPQRLRATHDLLSTVCVLGALSARTRLEAVARGDTARAWNAASAAASAIMLLDRARADLGLAPIRSRQRT